MGDGVMPIFAGSVLCWLLTQIRVYLDKHLTHIHVYHSLKRFYCPGLVSIYLCYFIINGFLVSFRQMLERYTKI